MFVLMDDIMVCTDLNHNLDKNSNSLFKIKIILPENEGWKIQFMINKKIPNLTYSKWIINTRSIYSTDI